MTLVVQKQIVQGYTRVCGNCSAPVWSTRSDSEIATRIERETAKHIERRIPSWMPAVEQRLRGFLDLPENWNCYGERRIDRRAVNASLRVLESLGPRVSEPVVSPLPDGGVQIEWVRDHLELEVEVRAGDPLALFCVNADGDEIDLDQSSIEDLQDHLVSMGFLPR